MVVPERVKLQIEKRLAREKYNLSILLLQQLVKVLKQNNLQTDFDIYTSGTNETITYAQTPDKRRLYEISHKNSDNSYSIRVNNGKYLISFDDNNICFTDKKHNYLQALYNMTYYGPANVSETTKNAVINLESKKVKPTLDSTLVWSECHMAVFSHLNKYVAR